MNDNYLEHRESYLFGNQSKTGIVTQYFVLLIYNGSVLQVFITRGAPVDHHLVGLLPVLFVSVGAHLRVQLLQVHSGHVGATPHGHCGSHRHSQIQIRVLLLV